MPSTSVTLGRMKRTLALAIALAGFTGAAVQQEQDGQESPVQSLMKAKSGYAHRLLDAVVAQDFDTVREEAFRLKAVAETGDWNVLDTPEYVRESQGFIQATERLLDSVKERNGDAVALAYMDVTLSCIHCHRYVRANLDRIR